MGAMDSAPRAKLRTKTGCLTCRKRRKKCDEGVPVCNACLVSGRQCQWPTSSELVDRRFLAHDQSRHKATSTKTSSPKADSTRANFRSCSPENEQILAIRFEQLFSNINFRDSLLPESGLAHRTLVHDLEPIVLRHFVDGFYDLLLLPNCHHGFHDGWLTEMQDLMLSYKSLYYSLLACAASHLRYIDTVDQMQELALVYYSNSVKELSTLVANTSLPENHNGLLMTVMFLYLHGYIGGSTRMDVPRHVAAATRILTLRLFHSPLTIEFMFDRLAVESVLYQIFLITTNLWSDPVELEYKFDANFWTRAEQLLDQSSLFPGRSRSFNSPVLGVPVSLFRLNLSLRQLYRCQPPHEEEVLNRLRGEVEWWETVLLQEQNHDPLTENDQLNDKERQYRDATYLYIIIASVLLEQLSVANMTPSPTPTPVKNCWKIKRGLQILQDHQHDDEWAKSFIGNWPVYALGFFVSSDEDKELVRADLQRKWDLTRFAQANRFSCDLEKTWALSVSA